MTFGERLQNLITARTDGKIEAYEKLLSDMGISTTRVLDPISNKKRPTYDELSTIMRHLDTSLDYLTELKDIDGNFIYLDGKNSGYFKND